MAVRRWAVGAVCAFAVVLAGCTSRSDEPLTVRLGYLPQVTHATALVGLEKGFFQQALGNDVRLQAVRFNAGPAVIEALFSGAIDAAYVGPSPTINGYVQSDGEAVRVVSGATSGGAFLVVRRGIDRPEDLRGKTLSTPQLGNTQDVALRHWLGTHSLSTELSGGGDVRIRPQPSAQILDAFAAGSIDGAWVPEPIASRLLAAGGTVLVDERDLWPEGMFVTTHLVVHPRLIAEHPQIVKALVRGSVEANAWISSSPAEAQAVVADAIGRLAGTPLPEGAVAASWKSLTFTDDPLAASLMTGAAHAAEIGVLPQGEPDLRGLYDLTALNEVLRAKGRPEMRAP